jgi:hypothetical protein
MTKSSIASTLVASLTLACGPAGPSEQSGFVTLLGRDTIAVENITRRGNQLVVDAVDRFPRVRRRHATITVDSVGAIAKLTMDVHTPSEPESERDRHIEANVGPDSVRIIKKDDSSTVRRTFATDGGIVEAHVPQMYSLYELYFQSARARKKQTGDTAQMRQFYIDREFDRFPLHRGVVQIKADNKAEIRHDWLSGTGEATFDSAGHMTAYSGARTTYQVSVTRVTTTPNIDSLAAQFTREEAARGKVKDLSPRDVSLGTIGSAEITIDYSRPLARGRVLLGGVIPFENVWRTGANAATQFKTTAPLSVAGITLAAGTYTLWTIPHRDGVDLVINSQHGQWGTEYNDRRNVGVAKMKSDSLATPVEAFTISVVPGDARHGTLRFEWGPFRWSAPIEIR